MKKTEENSAYLTREQLADELEISVRTLKQYEADGLRIHWLGGNVYRFLRVEVDAWIAARPQEKKAG